MEPGIGAQDDLEARRSDGTEGSQAVLTANADESEPELAWANPGVGEISGDVFVKGDQLNLCPLPRGSSLSRSCPSMIISASSLGATVSAANPRIRTASLQYLGSVEQ